MESTVIYAATPLATKRIFRKLFVPSLSLTQIRHNTETGEQILLGYQELQTKTPQIDSTKETFIFAALDDKNLKN